MNIPEYANKIITALNKNGFSAFVVGGFVRDSIMGFVPGDVDIATSALPCETEKVLENNNIKFIETGIKHGTITAVSMGEPVEITTFRTDGEYEDNRHPDTVSFVLNIEEDLKRRDFTINALAYSDKTGIVDLFGGENDIKSKLIRCVGNPDLRFKEDALRIMRALRFSSVLGFEIEEKTSQAIFNNKNLLLNVASERIFAELCKLLTGKNVYNVLDKYKDVISVIIPELKPTFNCVQNNPWHIYNVYYHIIHAVENAPSDVELRLAMLFHDIGKPSVKTTDEKGTDHFKTHAFKSAEIAENVLRRFHASNKLTEKVVQLVYYHQSIENVDEINVKRWISKIGAEQTKNLFLVRIADLKAHNPEKTAFESDMLHKTLASVNEIANANCAFSVKDLNVNGNDLINLGFNGKEIGAALNCVLEKVLNDELENDKNQILNYLKNDYVKKF